MFKPTDELRVDVPQEVLGITAWLGDKHLWYLLQVAVDLWERDPDPRVSVDELLCGRHPG